LFAPDFDGLDGREGLDHERPALVGVDQRGQSVEFAFLARTRFGVSKLLDATKSLLMCR
jgi:hypothetical protein